MSYSNARHLAHQAKQSSNPEIQKLGDALYGLARAAENDVEELKGKIRSLESLVYSLQSRTR
jgi:hypothetical protein